MCRFPNVFKVNLFSAQHAWPGPCVASLSSTNPCRIWPAQTIHKGNRFDSRSQSLQVIIQGSFIRASTLLIHPADVQRFAAFKQNNLAEKKTPKSAHKSLFPLNSEPSKLLPKFSFAHIIVILKTSQKGWEFKTIKYTPPTWEEPVALLKSKRLFGHLEILTFFLMSSQPRRKNSHHLRLGKLQEVYWRYWRVEFRSGCPSEM